MGNIIKIITLGLLTIVFCSLNFLTADETKEISIEGKYKIEEMVGAGKKRPAPKDFYYIFTKDTVKITIDGKIIMESQYKIDTSKTPFALTLPDAKDNHTSIVKIEKNKLTICSNSLDTSIATPKTFESNDENKYLLLTLIKEN